MPISPIILDLEWFKSMDVVVARNRFEYKQFLYKTIYYHRILERPRPGLSTGCRKMAATDVRSCPNLFALKANSAPGLIADLLGWVGLHSACKPKGDQQPQTTGRYVPAEVKMALDAGLGPLLHRAFATGDLPNVASYADALYSAYLTALVRHGSTRQVACDVIEICARLQVEVTLLKGISISEQFYPAGELRPMGDLDILVARPRAEAVEAAMANRGFLQGPGDSVPEDGHHGVPLYDARRQVWVEVHTALFSRKSLLHGPTLFTAEQIASWSVASTFEGHAVVRFRPEFQLVYLACSWVRDMSMQQVQPAFVLSLFDALFLLQAVGPDFDWDGLVSMLDNESAAASVYLLLSYVVAHEWDLSAAPILPGIAARQSLIRPLELAALHWILDRFLLHDRSNAPLARHWQATIAFNTLKSGGTAVGKWLKVPWNIVFPPSLAGRYRPGFHWARIARRLHRRP
jgi:hypothetical protein